MNSTALEGWKLEDNDRSSLDILWTCLSTIFACTWTALHLRVIKYDKFNKVDKNFWKSLMWIASILAPELMAIIAVQEAWEVKIIVGHCNSAQPGITTQSENSGPGHSSPVVASSKIAAGSKNSGSRRSSPGVPTGLASVLVEIATNSEKSKPGRSSPRPASATAEIAMRLNHKPWTFVQGFCIRMHGLVLRTKDDWVYVVRPADVVGLIQAGAIKQSDLRASEIKDRSKADSFAKAFTILQSSWAIINVITRAAYSLPISAIEISTVAYVVCAIGAYAAWWHKPKDMDLPITINLPYDRESFEMPPQVRNILDAGKDRWVHSLPDEENTKSIGVLKLIWICSPPALIWKVLQKAYKKILRHHKMRETSGDSQVTDSDEEAPGGLQSTNSIETAEPQSEDVFAEPLTVTDQFALDTLSFAAGLVFCGIHIAAWNFDFPTHAEKVAWRIFSIIAFAMCWPLLALSVAPLLKEWLRHGRKSPVPKDYDPTTKVRLSAMASMLLVYTFARLGNLILMFTSLRALPAGSYIDIVWLASIPHI